MSFIVSQVMVVSIQVEFREDELVAIVHMVGNPEASELEDTIRSAMIPILAKHQPETVNIVWDVRAFEWTFKQFIDFISLARKRRADNETPMNFKQYYVGQNTWAQNFRTWLKRNFNEDTGFFNELDEALIYIQKSA